MTVAISVLLVLIGIVATAAGFVILIYPPALRVRSRWYALPALMSLVGFVGLAMAISPTAGDATTSPGELRLVGGTLFALWAFIFGVSHFAVISKRRLLQSAPKVRADRTAAEVDATTRDARRAKLERQRGEFASQQTKPPISYPSPNRATAKRATKRTTASLATIRHDHFRPPVDEGRLISFEYVDANGEITDRQVRNWLIEDGYIHGYCTMRRATRQFRLDRVLDWRSWE